MKVKTFLERNPEIEHEIVDMYFRALKEGDKVKVSDVDGLMKRLTDEGIAPVKQPNAMAICNYYK